MESEGSRDAYRDMEISIRMVTDPEPANWLESPWGTGEPSGGSRTSLSVGLERQALWAHPVGGG
jgi:hypothetical protein